MQRKNQQKQSITRYLPSPSILKAILLRAAKNSVRAPETIITELSSLNEIKRTKMLISKYISNKKTGINDPSFDME